MIAIHCPECKARVSLGPEFFKEIIVDLVVVGRYIDDPCGDGAYTRLQAVIERLTNAG